MNGSCIAQPPDKTEWKAGGSNLKNQSFKRLHNDNSISTYRIFVILLLILIEYKTKNIQAGSNHSIALSKIWYKKMDVNFSTSIRSI